jgi:hypothetical protein
MPYRGMRSGAGMLNAEVAAMTDQNASTSFATVVSERDSGVRCDSRLPPIKSLLNVRTEGQIVIDVWAQLDAQRVRGIGLTGTHGCHPEHEDRLRGQ